MDLLAAHNLPFAVALAVLVLLLVVLLLGLGDLFGDADLDTDVDGGGVDFGASVASLLGIGRLPLLPWIAVLLASFGLAGLTIQSLLADPLAALPAALIAGGVALPVTSLAARALGRIWPSDETTAVPLDALLGKRGTIQIGRAARGAPARVRVLDAFDHPHHVMVEPHEDAAVLGEGDEVLLVRREGEIFYGVGGNEPFRLH